MRNYKAFPAHSKLKFMFFYSTRGSLADLQLRLCLSAADGCSLNHRLQMEQLIWASVCVTADAASGWGGSSASSEHQNPNDEGESKHRDTSSSSLGVFTSTWHHLLLLRSPSALLATQRSPHDWFLLLGETGRSFLNISASYSLNLGFA